MKLLDKTHDSILLKINNIIKATSSILRPRLIRLKDNFTNLTLDSYEWNWLTRQNFLCLWTEEPIELVIAPSRLFHARKHFGTTDELDTDLILILKELSQNASCRVEDVSVTGGFNFQVILTIRTQARNYPYRLVVEIRDQPRLVISTIYPVKADHKILYYQDRPRAICGSFKRNNKYRPTRDFWSESFVVLH